MEGELLQFESVAFERAIELESNVDDGIAVLGSIERLRRLVTTLLDNACKYAGDNGKVRVELHAQNGSARFVVHNTGSLISVEDLQHVFDRFYHADKARTSGAGGFGLGLSIAKEVAEEHGGTITAKSSDEEGTTFHSNPTNRVSAPIESNTRVKPRMGKSRRLTFPLHHIWLSAIYGNIACIFAP